MKTPDALVLVIPNLGGGGAERVMVNMARWWAERGTRVTLVTFSEDPTVYAVHPAVRRMFIDSATPDSLPSVPEWPAEAKNIAHLRAVLGQTPAHAPIVSFLPRMNLRTLLAARGLGRRIMVCERAWPPSCPLDATVERLRRALYPDASRVMVQTRWCAEKWAATFVPPERIGVIANAVVHMRPRTPDLHEARTPPLPGLFLVASGRLEEQKNFAALIDAFAAIAPVFQEAQCIILGEGSLRPALERRIAGYALTERVLLPGFVTNISAYMRRAYAFVLSSAFEGFPNVLLEAMAQGCPAVAFDCPTGPAEIIRHGTDGLLVPPGDTAALSAALAHLLHNAAWRDTLAQRAADVCERFAEDAIMEQWNRTVLQ